MAKRAPRPYTSHFDAGALAVAWGPLANMKKPGFEWDCSDYEKLSRSATPSVESLAKFAPALTHLLDLAPAGIPEMSAPRIALATLHAECKTFGPLADVCMFK
eukprot:9014390-Pyramimonas_sp.AAC.1